jgi:hypothetical protein
MSRDVLAISFEAFRGGVVGVRGGVISLGGVISRDGMTLIEKRDVTLGPLGTILLLI